MIAARIPIRVCFMILTAGLVLHCQTPQEQAQEFAFKPCPNFGTLASLPADALYSGDDGRRMLVVSTQNGTVAEVNPDLASGAEAITSKEKLDEFLKTYRDICASEPPFFNRIAWVKEDTRRRKEEEVEKMRIRHREQGEKLARELEELTKLKAESVKTRRAAKQQLAILDREIEGARPETFMVAGKVTQKVAGGVEFYGNAVPGGEYSAPGAMVMQKGYGILQNPTENDVPGGLMVYAEQVFFIGQSQGLNVYSRESSTPVLIRYRSLVQQKDELKAKLRLMDVELTGYDETQTVLRNQYPEVPLPPEP